MTRTARGNALFAGLLILIVGSAVVAVRALNGPQSLAATQPASRPADKKRLAAEGRTARPVSPKSVKLGELSEPWILVEKSDHRLTVCDGRRPVKTYRCAVGGGKGNKVREGDRCTPEGVFYVCVKNPQSQYTRALGLSYPNVEDARRGLRDGLIDGAEHDEIVKAIKRGTRPPWKTELGGEIMIHGNGAGRDWTAGCVALDDDDILEVYAAIPLHTPVKIVP